MAGSDTRSLRDSKVPVVFYSHPFLRNERQITSAYDSAEFCTNAPPGGRARIKHARRHNDKVKTANILDTTRLILHYYLFGITHSLPIL